MKYPEEWNAKAIENQTKKAFDMCSLMNDSSDFPKRDENIERAFVLLKQPGMKGIGTATASLILSVYDVEISILIRRGLAVVIPSHGKDPYTPQNYTNFVSNPKETRETVRGEEHSR